MKARLFGLALVASAGLVCAGTPAFALSCSGGAIFAGPGSTTEGTNTYPGTNVGTVGCGLTDTGQIGNLTLYNSGSGGAYVNTNNNPVNYEFSFAGGSPLKITGKIGNNGIGDAIDMELLSWDGTTATLISSIQIPFSSGPSAFYTLYSDSDPILGAGNYIISTYLAVGNVVDPNFQINFALSQTPLPAALPLFASGLGAMGLLGWRKKRKAAAAA